MTLNSETLAQMKTEKATFLYGGTLIFLVTTITGKIRINHKTPIITPPLAFDSKCSLDDTAKQFKRSASNM